MHEQIQTAQGSTFSMDYFRFGNGAETLVIIPGLSVQSVMGLADAVAEAYQPLADDFTIYVLDKRKDLPETYPVCDMAQDTVEALQVLGLDHVNLFGASLGGMIAQEIAIRWPNLVRRLVLGSTAACVTEEQFRVIGEWIALAERGDARNLYLKFGEAIYPSSVFEQSRELLEQAAGTVTGEDLSRFVVLARGTKGFDVTDRLGQVECPVLALGSSDDQVLGGDATLQIARCFEGRSNFEMHLYDGYGHAAYDIAPDYKDRMRRFLIEK